MYKVKNILNSLNKAIPPTLAELWDNSGFLVGDSEDTVISIMLSLDITTSVIEEAIQLGCNLLISHHPVIFDPIKSVTHSGEGMIVSKLLRNRLNAICIHTPLDAVCGGINDILACKCGFLSSVPLSDADGIGRIGKTADPCSFENFVAGIKRSLQIPAVICHNADKPVNKVAFVSGSGDDYLKYAFEAGCDTFLTGDLKHHMFVHAANLGLNVVCAGHFYSEVIGLTLIEDILTKGFDQIKIYHSSAEYRMYTVC